MSITIGNITLEAPVILAPMSGVTDLPFRRLVKSYGCGLVVSEMIASHAMIHATRRSMKMSTSCAEEFPMSVQLAGCEPAMVAEAAKLNEDRGAAIIDINMGCPVKKVVNGDAGSALMRDLTHAVKILEATVKAVKLPVTLKMRTGWDDNTRNAPELARMAEDVGIQMLTVHGRTRCQMYRGHADWDFVGEVVDAVNLPVVVNGDINTFDDVDEALNKSGAAGVMLGRGTYGRPWFPRQVMDYLATGKRSAEPELQERMDVMLSHYDDMIAHYGVDIAVPMARKHMGWYTKGLPNSTDMRNELNRMSDPDRVKDHLRAYFERIMAENAAEAA